MKNFMLKMQTRLLYYSPYRFIKELSNEYLVNNTVIEPLLSELTNKDTQIIEINVDNFVHYFILKKMVWDSDYFGFENYKIINVLFDHNNIATLIKATSIFKRDYCNVPQAYYFFDIPSEDTFLQQAFTGNGFRLIETRLNYYINNLKEYIPKERFSTRLAGENDAQHLRNIAMKMQNRFDRVHADEQISNIIADKYIGQFAFNSVKGFADFVLVPDVKGNIPFGFLAFNKPLDIGELKVSKLVLTAIDNSTEKGWLYKLVSETIYKLREHDTDYLTTITQSSNTPAFKTWEKFGFKLGFVTNMIALKNG